jgi:NAD(P)-dependent dehydrogenase (short-subunit alcohol dehydrogenase family)
VSVELSNAGVVVTGAARGIGEALARRFAAAGARLVLADLEPSVEDVAKSLGAEAVVGDVAGQAGAEHLIGTAREWLGGDIDLFCANAGIAPMGGPEVPDEEWDTIWNVNVMSHVRAARLLLPAWLERERGHFLATVSAAGLLTGLGSAPYSVTKHGALAFAEWLLATYKHRGIGVQALCPLGVQTKLLADTDPAGRELVAEGAVTPEYVADVVMAALRGDEFLILPHPEVAGYFAYRATQHSSWIDGLNKHQRELEARWPA